MFNATSLGDKGQPMTITSRSTSSAYLSAVQPVTEIRFTVRWRLLTVFARHFHDFLKIAEKYSSIAPERVYPVSAVNTFSLQYPDLSSSDTLPVRPSFMAESLRNLPSHSSNLIRLRPYGLMRPPSTFLPTHNATDPPTQGEIVLLCLPRPSNRLPLCLSCSK